MWSDAQRRALRQIGQLDLGEWLRATGSELWVKQDQILTGLSTPRSQIVVPSCNASGKTWLAGNAAVAFYDSYTPGTPCLECDPTGTKGGCRGCKVLTTSSKETHLKDNLWGEIRLAMARLAAAGIPIDGYLPPADTWLEDGPAHFIRGQVATKEESFQGYHSPHKLIIGDEATSVSDDVAKGIMSLQATADTRLLLIFNPTTSNTYAAQMARSVDSEVIRIRAYDTPHFTGEHVPENSNLVTPLFLQRMQNNGEGEGSYMWTTRVLAEFWDKGDDLLIPPGWVHAAKAREPLMLGTVGLGIDLAPYGNAESAIAIRRGDNLVDITAHAAGRTDFFINGNPEETSVLSPVRRAVVEYGPSVIVYDADGVGAGAIGDFTRLHDWAIKNRYMLPDSRIIGFRGGAKISDLYTNARGGWWWALRKRFERGTISMMVRDPKLDAQLSQMTYGYTQAGLIRVETKDEMRKRGLESPDRADAVMYCFAYSMELPDANDNAASSGFVVSAGYATDRSEEAMWERDLNPQRRNREAINPVTGVPDQF